MQGTILLNYNENVRQVEEEEKSRFIKSFLEACFADVPDIVDHISTIWNNDGPLSPDQKIKIRNILNTYNIQIVDDLDGHLDVHLENERVAEWYKPTYKLRRDLSQKDRKKQFYIEMLVKYWSIFDEQMPEEK